MRSYNNGFRLQGSRREASRRRLLFALTLSVAGCGKATTTLSGTIKYKGEALTVGTVTVYGADDKQATGTIDNGKYLVEGAPTGPVTITVSVPKQMPGAKGGGAKAAEKMKGAPGADNNAPAMPGGGAGGAPKNIVKIPDNLRRKGDFRNHHDPREGPRTFDIDLK